MNLVLKFMPYNLSKVIFDSSKQISDLLKLELCLAIARGMDYLHSNDIIHCNLKVTYVHFLL